MPCSWELYIEREDMQQVVGTLKLHLKSEDHYTSKANLSHAGAGQSSIKIIQVAFPLWPSDTSTLAISWAHSNFLLGEHN